MIQCTKTPKYGTTMTCAQKLNILIVFFNLVCEAKTSERTKYSLFKTVIIEIKTLISFHFMCQSSSHCVVLRSSKNNDPNLQIHSVSSSLRYFVHTFNVWKFFCFEDKMSDWVTDKLICNAQCCNVQKVAFFKTWEFKIIQAFRFPWFSK